MLLLPKFRWIIQKCQRNNVSFEPVTPSQSNSSADQPSACQWWLFIHHETSTGSSLWSPGQQPWQLSPQLTGSSFRLLWAWPCLAIEANIAHQTKQFMSRSNFDLGPPKNAIALGKWKDLDMWGHKTLIGIVWGKNVNWDKTCATSFDLTGYFWISCSFSYIYAFFLNRFFSASVLVLFPAGDPVTWSVTRWFRSKAWDGSFFTAGVCLALSSLTSTCFCLKGSVYGVSCL